MLERRLMVQQVLDTIEPFLPTGIDVGVCYNNFVALAGIGDYRKNIGTERPHPVYAEVMDKQSLYVIQSAKHDLCNSCSCKKECPYTMILSRPIMTNTNHAVEGVLSLLSRDKMLDTFRYTSILENLAKVVQSVWDNCKEDRHSLSTILNIINESIITVDAKGCIVNASTKANKLIRPNQDFSGINIKKIFPSLNLTKRENALSENHIIVYPVSGAGYVLHILDFNRMESENAFSKMIGSSKVIMDLKKQALEIAAMDATVLICGETGTGKELMVKGIHQTSSRKKKPFITVNCGAIPEALMESELFGYSGGAFTGARKEGKAGKFELAHEGTLFLDEIGELSLPLQAKLLRILEENSIDRLGGHRPIDIDVRVIAATNRDLSEMVNEGKFRQDLYYRLNAFMLELPPLRERKEDIPLIIDYYLNYFNSKFNKNITIDTLLLDCLVNYTWPGNIRELRNALEFSISLEKKDILTIESLPIWLQKQLNMATQIYPIKKGTEISERDAIQEALNLYGKSTEGRIQAAQKLGVSLATLYRKMRKYDCHN